MDASLKKTQAFIRKMKNFPQPNNFPSTAHPPKPPSHLPNPKDTRKVKIRINVDQETVVPFSEELSGSQPVSKVKTSMYSPSKSFGKSHTNEFSNSVYISPTKPLMSMTKEVKNKFLISPTRKSIQNPKPEEIKVYMSEGKLRKPKIIEDGASSARKYFLDKSQPYFFAR